MAAGDILAYGNGWSWIMSNPNDLVSNIGVMLTTAHTLAQTNDWVSDIVADEFVDASYSRGALANVTVTKTNANSWGTTWGASTAYVVGDIVRPVAGNGWLFKCVVAGTSAASEPTWDTTPGQDTADNTVVWSNIGVAVIVIDADNFTFTGLDGGTPDYAHFYQNEPGTDATRPLLYSMELGTAANGSDYTLSFDAQGIYAFGVV